MSRDILKILITGTNSVGKTTLAGTLSAKLKIDLIEESSRQVLKSLGLSDFTQLTDQIQFSQKVLDMQIARQNSFKSYIADRGLVDCWAHYLRWHINTSMTYDSESFYQKCLNNSQEYTHVIFIPQMIEPQEDGIRWCDPVYLLQLERLIKATLYEFNLLSKTYFIKSSNLDERVNEVATWLQM